MEPTPIDKPRSEVPRKSEAEQISYFNQGMDRFSAAIRQKSPIRRYYEIGGTIVCLTFAGDALIPLLTRALSHLERTDDPEAGFEICVWDSRSTDTEMLPPPCDRASFTERGDFWGFNSKRIRMAFHYSDFSLNMMDLETRTGFFWVKDAGFLPPWVFAAPFRSLFQWWMELNGGQLLHAAAVGTPEGAVLISGKGGVGKSTTALSCLAAGMLYMGDDYLIVRKDPYPQVFTLYNTAKILPADTHRFPELKKSISEAEADDTFDKKVLYLYPEYRNQLCRSLPLKAIMKPEICREASSMLSEIPYTSILGAISFTTMTQLPYAGEYTRKMISELIARLPCFSLSLGKDLPSTPSLLKSYLSGTLPVENIRAHIQNEHGERPLISIIIPVFNGERFIEEAVNCIRSQQYPSLEIIFVDDGSTDQSAAIITSLKTDYRYFRQENQGPTAARNRGIREATGDYIAFLDVDDLWPDNNLHHLMDELLADASLLAVHGYAQLTEKDSATGKYEYLGNPGESFPGYLGAGLYSKTIFSVVGMFDPLFAYTGEDADWFKRASEMRAPIRKLEEVTLFVRRHGENITGGRSLVELNTLKVFKRSLDRVRNPYPEKGVTLDVSVIIPVYNGEKYLAEALHSVLSQEEGYREVIVVDDGSVDQSLAVAERFLPLVRILKQENRGAAAARNTGIEASGGSYIAFLDADDLWMPQHTTLLMNALEEHPEYEIAAGSVEQFISPDCPDTPRLREELRIMPGYHLGCILMRRTTFDRIGWFNEKLNIAEVIDWFSRMEQSGIRIFHIHDVVYQRRIHTTNQGITKRDHLTEIASVLHQKLQRHKGEQIL
ncbi:MAG TPA: glycosyltransferase [Bacteroidales bacterium]|nr:glycosyltransferase [Bacteroidales bacterium]HRZ49352.1 glycosyltransferase [Bacteroidales bacterium]